MAGYINVLSESVNLVLSLVGWVFFSVADAGRCCNYSFTEAPGLMKSISLANLKVTHHVRLKRAELGSIRLVLVIAVMSSRFLAFEAILLGPGVKITSYNRSNLPFVRERIIKITRETIYVMVKPIPLFSFLNWQ